MAPTSERILSGCPIDFALELFGDRWTLLVVRDLLVRRKRHFREMMASDEGIATNILTDRLKKLERWGVIERRTDQANRRQIVYSLTQKGLDLAPVLVEIAIWSARYDPHTKINKAWRHRAREDRDALAKETVADFLTRLREAAEEPDRAE